MDEKPKQQDIIGLRIMLEAYHSLTLDGQSLARFVFASMWEEGLNWSEEERENLDNIKQGFAGKGEGE